MTDLQLTACDWSQITGRGLVVVLDLREEAARGCIRRGDRVKFVLSPDSPGDEGLVDPDATYTVIGVEESRGLTDPPVLLGRSVCVRIDTMEKVALEHALQNPGSATSLWECACGRVGAPVPGETSHADHVAAVLESLGVDRGVQAER